MARSNRQPDRDYGGRFAAGLFAATVVLTTGAGACAMMAFLFAQNVWQPLVVIGGVIVGVVLLLWIPTERTPRRAQDSGDFIAEKERLDKYVATFRPKHRRRGGREYGSKQPPTVEDLRQIKEDSNAWHPSERRVEEYRKDLGGSGK